MIPRHIDGRWVLIGDSEWSSMHESPGGGESLVQQQFGEEVDINTIVRRFGITAGMPLGPDTGVYGDFTDIFDYDSAVEKIEGARKRFMGLPPEVRERFKNDPGELIRYAQSVPEDEFVSSFETRPATEGA